MDIKDLLTEKRSDIVRGWFDLILETYPQETAIFLKDQKDRFANPVGQTILSGIENLFDEIVNSPDPEKVNEYLDNIIRIRAVQDFSPSDAIGFLFLLKNVIRNELLKDIRRNDLFEELLVIESGIDNLAGISFDIFMKCREKLYDLKANEVRNWTCRLLKSANMVKEVPAE
jgi:hypothetical protein